MAEPLKDFHAKFDLSHATVRRFDSWTWSLRPMQCTLGTSVLSLNREATALSQVSAAELGSLADAVGAVERRMARAFAYDKINYLMLMMVDPQVHFHVVPRYAAPRRFAGATWEDKGWPTAPVLTGPPLTPELRQALLEILAT